MTEDDVPQVLAKNVEWVHAYLRPQDFSDLSELFVDQIISALKVGLAKYRSQLRILTLQTDDRLGLDPGTSLTIVRHLIASRRLRVDMRRPIDPCERLPLLGEDDNSKGL